MVTVDRPFDDAFLSGMAGCAVIGLLLIFLTEPKRLFAGPTAGGEQVAPHAPIEA